MLTSRKGIHVFATARSLSSLTYLKDLPNVTILELDVTSDESIAAAFAVVKTKTQTSTPDINTSNSDINTSPTLRLKYLINNAGLGLVSPLLNGYGIADSERAVFETNVWGPLALIRTFAPLMITFTSTSNPKPGKSGNSGTVVNITSGGAMVPLVWNGVYAASKAAMLMLSETLRLELEPLGVGTITVVLGIVKTNFHDNLRKKREGEGRGDRERLQVAKGSYYRGMKGVLEEEASGKVQDERVMRADEAGRRIVGDAIKGRRGRTYVGTKAGVVRWVGVFPGWLVVSFCFFYYSFSNLPSSF